MCCPAGENPTLHSGCATMGRLKCGSCRDRTRTCLTACLTACLTDDGGGGGAVIGSLYFRCVRSGLVPQHAMPHTFSVCPALFRRFLVTTSLHCRAATNALEATFFLRNCFILLSCGTQWMRCALPCCIHSVFVCAVLLCCMRRDLKVLGGAVFWPPKAQQPEAAWVKASDHRPVYLDVQVCAGKSGSS
jgi:hypothetical protein